MQVDQVIVQLRTPNLERTLRFYVERLGFTLEFRYQDFYAGIRSGAHLIHLKLVDDPDPSIAWVTAEDHFHLYLTVADVAACASQLRAAGVPIERDVHETPWQTRECVIRDDVGHTIYFGQPLGG